GFQPVSGPHRLEAYATRFTFAIARLPPYHGWRAVRDAHTMRIEEAARMRQLAWVGGVVLGIGLLLAAPAWAVITRLMPLKEVLAESDPSCIVKVERLDPEKPAVVFTVEEDLKGKAPFRRLPMNLTGDSEAKKDNHTPQLLKRLAPDLTLVLFANGRGKRYTAFFYTNGTWFQAVGLKADDAVRWSFTHCEPYLR